MIRLFLSMVLSATVFVPSPNPDAGVRGTVLLGCLALQVRKKSSQKGENDGGENADKEKKEDAPSGEEKDDVKEEDLKAVSKKETAVEKETAVKKEEKKSSKQETSSANQSNKYDKNGIAGSIASFIGAIIALFFGWSFVPKDVEARSKAVVEYVTSPNTLGAGAEDAKQQAANCLQNGPKYPLSAPVNGMIKVLLFFTGSAKDSYTAQCARCLTDIKSVFFQLGKSLCQHENPNKTACTPLEEASAKLSFCFNPPNTPESGTVGSGNWCRNDANDHVFSWLENFQSFWHIGGRFFSFIFCFVVSCTLFVVSCFPVFRSVAKSIKGSEGQNKTDLAGSADV